MRHKSFALARFWPAALLPGCLLLAGCGGAAKAGDQAVHLTPASNCWQWLTNNGQHKGYVAGIAGRAEVPANESELGGIKQFVDEELESGCLHAQQAHKAEQITLASIVPLKTDSLRGSSTCSDWQTTSNEVRLKFAAPYVLPGVTKQMIYNRITVQCEAMISACRGSTTKLSWAATQPAAFFPKPSACPSGSKSPAGAVNGVATQTLSHLRTISFSFTTSPEGWQYSGTVPWPQQSVSLTKNIASSPPGSAKLAIELKGESVETLTFPDTNAGRPNGPTLEIPAGSLVYPVPTKGFLEGEQAIAPRNPNPCEWGGREPGNLGTLYTQPFDSELLCPAGSTSGISEDASEKGVDEAIGVISKDRPTYVINFTRTQDKSCNFFISPTGRITRSAQYETAHCEPVQLKING